MQKQIAVLNRGTMVELVSDALIVAVGVWTFYRAATGELHAHHEGGGDRHDRASGHHHRLDPRLIRATA